MRARESETVNVRKRERDRGRDGWMDGERMGWGGGRRGLILTGLWYKLVL